MNTTSLIRAALDEALKLNKVTSISEWVVRHPGSHLWVVIPGPFGIVIVCGACSVVREGVVLAPTCKGIVPVMPRIDRAAKRSA